MWGSVMAVNSFVIWPITLVFLVYSVGRLVIFWDWKTFILALLIFTACTLAQMVIGVLAD
jgi:hypothetical protein